VYTTARGCSGKQELVETDTNVPPLDIGLSWQAVASPQADVCTAAALHDSSDMPEDSAVLECESDASWLEQSEWLDDGSDVSPTLASCAAAASSLTYTQSVIITQSIIITQSVIITKLRYPNLIRPYGGFREPRGSSLTPLKSTFNAEHFVGRLSWSILNGFGAIHS